MKPPRNWITISPTDSDSKQSLSFLGINKVKASKYNKLQESLKQSQKNSTPRGQGGASNKKKSSLSTAQKAQPQRGRSTSKHRTQQQGSRQPHQQKGKADDTTNVVSNEHGRNSMRCRRSRSQPKKKTSSTDQNKQRLHTATN